MPIGLRCALAAIVLVGCGAEDEAHAQAFTMRRPPEFGMEVAGPDSRLANPDDWPVTFIFRVPGTPGCTATAVAAKVILTAAHCFGPDGTGTLLIDSQQVPVTCEKHPQWPQSPSADYALCFLGSPLGKPTAGFETLSLDDAALAQNAEVTLLGFGCRRDGSAGFGLLAEGKTNVAKVSPEFVETAGRSTICTGDSGGAAYLASGAFAAKRRVVALNHASGGSRSYLSRVGNPQFQSWATQWSAAKAVHVCGLDAAAVDCRP